MSQAYRWDMQGGVILYGKDSVLMPENAPRLINTLLARVRVLEGLVIEAATWPIADDEWLMWESRAKRALADRGDA